MTRTLAWVSFGLAIALLCVAAQTPRTTINVDEIHAGMRGYGLTVFRGTKPERFDVEVIDVLHNFRPSQDLILIRTPDPLLNEARGVGGMSGSPVYLDGRLAGAYAYGWPNSINPVVGVTPIRDMLMELRRPIRVEMYPGAIASTAIHGQTSRGQTPIARAHQPSRKTAHLNATPRSAMPKHRNALDALHELAAARAPVVDSNSFAPVRTPIALGGLTESVANEVASWFEALGMTATSAASSYERKPTSKAAQNNDPGARFNKAPTSYEPGGSIAVTLARGDVSLTGVGTVTYVAPNGVTLAFGHPMVNLGPVGLPTATARVLHVLSSHVRSFKIAEALEPLGLLAHDQQAAIVVAPSLQPRMIPVRVKVNGVPGAHKTEWNVDVANHKAFTPTIIYTVMLNALSVTANAKTDVVFRAHTRLGVEGHPDVVATQSGFSREGIALPTALNQLSMFSTLAATYDNPFEHTRVTSVDVELDVDMRSDVLQIESASVSATEVDPGATVNVFVQTRQIDGERKLHTIPVAIPKSSAGTNVRLVVASGAQTAVDLAQPTSLQELFDALQPRFDASSIVVSVQTSEPSVALRGHVLRSLPDSVANALHTTTNTSSVDQHGTTYFVKHPVQQPVYGAANFQLKVRKTAKGQP